MTIASLDPATIRSNAVFDTSSNVGLPETSPSIKAILVALTGPLKGIFDIVRAADAPMSPSMSGGFTRSADKTVSIT